MQSAKVTYYCDEFAHTFLESPSLVDVVRDITEDLFQRAFIAAGELQQIDIPCEGNQHGETESDDILCAVEEVVEELFQEASATTVLSRLPSNFERVPEDNEITEKAKDVFETCLSRKKSHTCQRYYNTLLEVCNDPSPSSPDFPTSQEMPCSNEVGMPQIDELAVAMETDNTLYNGVRELDTSLVEGESVRKEESNTNKHQLEKEITIKCSSKLTDAETGIRQHFDSKQSPDGSNQPLAEEDELFEYIQMEQTSSPIFHVSCECHQVEQECSLDPAGRSLEGPPCKMSKLDEHLGIFETSMTVEKGTVESALVTSSNLVCDEGKFSFSEGILNSATVPLGASREISDTSGCSEKTPKPVCSDEEMRTFVLEDGSSVAHVRSHDYVRFAIDKVYSCDDKELGMDSGPTTLHGDLGQELQEAMKPCQDQTVPSLQEEVDNCIHGNSVNGLYTMDEEISISEDVKHTGADGAFPNVNEIEDQTVTEKIPDISDDVEQKFQTDSSHLAGVNQQVPGSSLPLFHWRNSIDYQNQQPAQHGQVQPGIALNEHTAPGVDWSPRPLPPCNRKRRIGLSRRQRVTHLHSVSHPACQQIQQQREPAQKQEE